MKNGEIEISFSSELEYLDLIQNVSESVTQTLGFDEDTRYWIGMSVRESVTNAIQHGNKLDAEKKVGVSFRVARDRLVILIRDEGEGFEESEIPNPLEPENVLKPSGRGIFYVRTFMDEVSFRRLPEGGTEVKMEKKLSRRTQDKNNQGGDHEN